MKIHLYPLNYPPPFFYINNLLFLFFKIFVAPGIPLSRDESKRVMVKYSTSASRGRSIKFKDFIKYVGHIKC